MLHCFFLVFLPLIIGLFCTFFVLFSCSAISFRFFSVFWFFHTASINSSRDIFTRSPALNKLSHFSFACRFILPAIFCMMVQGFHGKLILSFKSPLVTQLSCFCFCFYLQYPSPILNNFFLSEFLAWQVTIICVQTIVCIPAAVTTTPQPPYP